MHSSTLIAFRGDPVVHLPPFGPNFPVTLKNPISLDLGGIHIGLGTPLPQVDQQYRTAADLFYIDKDGAVEARVSSGAGGAQFPRPQLGSLQRGAEWHRQPAGSGCMILTPSGWRRACGPMAHGFSEGS